MVTDTMRANCGDRHMVTDTVFCVLHGSFFHVSTQKGDCHRCITYIKNTDISFFCHIIAS